MSEPTWKERLEELASAFDAPEKLVVNLDVAERLRGYTKDSPKRASYGVASFIAAEVTSQIAASRRPILEHFRLVELACKAFIACREAARAEQGAN